MGCDDDGFFSPGENITAGQNSTPPITGTYAETFIDDRDRRAFDNFDEYLELYGCERLIREMAAPRISSARHVPQALKDLIYGRPTAHSMTA